MLRLKKTYLLTGANLGDRFTNMARAVELLRGRAGEVTRVSGLYETAPWGNVVQPHYLNQAIELLTELTPAKLLKTTQRIEEELGRIRQTKWGARIIDIDILFYEDHIVATPTLTIPHPHIHRRNFVMVPMLDIAPQWQHPVFKKTIEELYRASEDELKVERVERLGTHSNLQPINQR